jgi:glycosyltransferase involved in cell wall biosynthesis
MKVVHLTSVHAAHDVRIFHKQCKSLAKAGYEVTLVVKSDTDKEIDCIRISTIQEYDNRLKRFFLYSWSVYKKAVESEASICHFHDPELIFIGALLRLRGKKVIYDVHEDLPRQILSKSWIKPWVRYPVSWSAAFVEWVGSRLFFSGIVAATPTIANRFPQDKTVLIRNYPIIEEALSRTKSAWAGRLEQVIYVGGIDKTRGVIENIKAIGLLKNEKIRMSLAGPFSSKALEEECREYDGWRYVDYFSWLSRDDVMAMLAESKAGLVVLHPTPAYLESYPIKMFEYMLAGIPVIASDFPIWREIVDSSKCGLLVDPLVPEETAKAIRWVLKHPEEAEKMGNNGRRAIEEKYNWAREEKALLRLYEKLGT